MIEDYLSASRRTKPTTDEIVGQYNLYYKLLALQLQFGLKLPELTVVYSADRRCELVSIGEDPRYLVYDQYLGQSFNKLNRNQFAKHSRDQLAKQYASKYLAEKLLLKGETVRASVLALLSVGFGSYIKEIGDPYVDGKTDNEKKRYEYIIIQEIFVIAHEIGHFLYFANRNAQKKPEEHIKECLIAFIDKSKMTNEKYDRLVNRYGKGLAERVLTENHEDRHSNTLKNNPELIVEAFADQMGALMTFRVATEYFEINPEIVIEGIVLGHKYLRLFQALDTLADTLCHSNWGNPEADISFLSKQLKECVWKGKHGNIEMTQLREHFLRSELLDFGGYVGMKGELKDLPNIVDAYDEHTEFPILLDLVDVLLEEKTIELPELISESGKTENNLIDDVDSITGWAQ